MRPIYFMFAVMWFLFIFVLIPQKKRETTAAAHHIRKKGEKEREAMEALAKQFIGKECIIYTITSNDGSVQGTIKEVNGGGMLIEDARGQQQAVNLEYVTRIREYPRNKKGQKKSVILD